MYRTRLLNARQDPYDAIPRSVQGRDDITFGAKCLYGALRTAQNTRRQLTYAELAEHIHASVRSIVRWVQQLVAAGLIAVKRRGQGLPNLFVLIGVTSGYAATATAGMTAWQRPAPRLSKKAEERQGYTRDPERNYRETREGLLPVRT